MPVTDFLERNVKLYGDETALVELNPDKAIRMILGCKIDPFNLLIFSIFLK